MSRTSRLLEQKPPAHPCLAEGHDDIVYESDELDTSSEVDGADVESMDANTTNDAYVVLPLSDFPDILPSDSGEHSPEVDAPAPSNPRRLPATVHVQPQEAIIADMGANGSREDVSAAIRATADELQDRGALGPPGTGKLKRLSTPAYPQPQPRAQRRLRAPKQARPNPYDPPLSPRDALPSKKRQLQDPPDISPLKRQKARKQISRARVPSLESEIKVRQSAEEQLLAEDARAEEVARRWQQAPKVVIPAQRVGEEAEGAVEAGAEAELTTHETLEEDPLPSVTGPAQVLLKRSRGRPCKEASEEPEKFPSSRPLELELATIKTSQLKQVSSDSAIKPSQLEKNRTRTSRDIDAVPANTSTEHALRSKTQTARDEPSDKSNRTSSTRIRRHIHAQNSAVEAQAIREEHADGPKEVGDFGSPARGQCSDDQYEPPGDPGEEGESEREDVEAEEDSGDGDDLPDNPLTRREADRVRLSEMGLAVDDHGDSGDDEDDHDDSDGEEDGVEKQTTANKCKREASGQSANTSRKRARTRSRPQDAAAASVPHSDGGEEASIDAGRMFCQWPLLRKAFNGRHNVGVSEAGGARHRHIIKLKDEEVKTIVELCDETAARLTVLRDADGDLEAKQSIATDFIEIGDRVHALYEDAESTEKHERKVKCIYFHLIPKLVELLEDTIACCEDMDRTVTAKGSLTRGHLNLVSVLVKLILDLGEGVKKYERPSSELALVKPVRNEILAPLKVVHSEFRKELHRMHQIEEYTKQAEQRAKTRALQAQREEEESRHKRDVRQRREEWNALHDHRQWAEVNSYMRPEKRKHLRAPSPAAEFDQDGMAFERVELFNPRVGPSPAMVEKAREKKWSMPELAALSESLERYRGPDVFKRLFYRHCTKTGLLNAYNVTEIVTVAADLKAYLMDKQQEEPGGVQDWVKAIPVWTKGQSPGKENEAGAVRDDGDAI